MLRALADSGLFGRTFGRGRPRVLALPGWMHGPDDFALLDVDRLGIGVVAVDLPGFTGASPPPPEAWGTADYAAVVAPVLRSEFDVPPVVLGHSFGGRVALHLAADHPDEVAGLVLAGVPRLVAAVHRPKPPSLRYRVVRTLHRRGLVGDERMEAMRRRSGSADYRAATGVMRDVLVRVTNEVYEEQVRRLQCPVELVWGADDDQAPVDVARAAAALLGGRARLTELPGTGHFVPTEAPDAVAAALSRLLS